MTMTADRPTTQLGPGDARSTLLEMAAVIRTVFGVGLEASRRAGETVAAEAAPLQEQVIATPAAATYTAPASIPMPDLAPVAPQPETASAPEAPTPYTGEVPALRVVPNPLGPLDDVQPEQRQAVLREVAFLDD
jgi:hypothetical protein